ncbi:hypothetical protein ABPG72_018839 [Tetrahymena utriculariae]
MSDKKYVNVFEFEDEAKKNLTNNAYTYYRSGANAEHTLRDNIDAYSRIKLNPYVCAGLKDIDLTTTVLGQKLSIPIGIAPSAMHRMATPRGELTTVTAAKKVGTIYTLSSLATTNMEDVAKEQPDALRWFQLYIAKDRKITEVMVREAERLGYRAIAVTVDAPYLGIREGDERNKFTLPPHLKLEILESFKKEFAVKGKEGSGLFEMFKDQIDPAMSWEDIKWLKSFTKLPVILKGIQNGEDALRAAQLGVHIWVTNHGGRQLDTVRSTIDMLPEVMHAIKDYRNTVEVYVDGGIRRGTDVLKCLALGAKCVFIGRPLLFSLAAEGEQGVLKMFELFEKEMKVAMMLLGAGKISDLGLKHLVKATIPVSNL